MPIIDSVSESLDELADAEASFKKRRKKGDRRSSQILDRLPPHSTEAEMGVLGCVLIEPSILPEARAKIKSHIVFYDLRHQTIWETLCAMSDASTPIDLITVQQNLKDRQLLEQIGGIAYLSQLQDAVPSAANFSYYASITLEKHALRRTIATCSGVVGKVYDYEGEVEALITEVEREILSIRGTFNNDADLVDISSVQQKVIAQYEAAFNGNQHFGLQTGFDGLDNIIGGMLEQELIMVGGSPSAGKCLKWDSEILLADGSVKTIGDIYGARSASLLTLGDDLRFKIVSASDFVDDGIKPTFCVKTRLGKKISTTSTHPFLTISGWKKLSELKPGDKVAVPRRAGVFGNRAASDDAIKVLAYLIGDGCMVHGGTPLFTNKNPRLMNEFVESAGREFGSVCKIHGPASGRSPTAHVSHNKSKHNKDVVAFQKWIGAALDNSGISDRQIALRIGKSTSLPSMWRSGVCVPSFEDCAILGELLCVNVEEMASTPRVEAKNKLAAWLKEIGIFGKDSFSKFIPQFIFTCPKRQVALFLNRLFATDGFACVAKDGRSQIGYSSNSERLCRQVQHLLLRFGIVAMVRKKNMTVNVSV